MIICGFGAPGTSSVLKEQRAALACCELQKAVKETRQDKARQDKTRLDNDNDNDNDNDKDKDNGKDKDNDNDNDIDNDNDKTRQEGTAAAFFDADVAVGIATGVAFCGNVGSPCRMEYCFVGDVVNTSARLMGVSRHKENLQTVRE